jgi:hypothetical protein
MLSANNAKIIFPRSVAQAFRPAGPRGADLKVCATPTSACFRTA